MPPNYSITTLNVRSARRTGSEYLRGCAVILGGALFRRVLERPDEPPGAAPALPDGFHLAEHSHGYALPFVLGGVASTAGPWSVSEGDALSITFSGAPYTATIQQGDVANLAAATSAELAAVLDRDITGSRIESYGDRVYILAPVAGTVVHVTGGTLNASMGFSTDPVWGLQASGNQDRFLSDESDEIDYVVDVLDPAQTESDVIPTLRAWSQALSS